MISVKVRGDFVEGKFRRPAKPEHKIVSVDPGDTGVRIATFGIYPQHIDASVEAAARAFSEWRLLDHGDRANMLRKFAAELVNRRNEITNLVSLETGKPLWEAEQEVRGVESQAETEIREGVRAVSPFKVGEVRFGVEGRAWYEPLGVTAVLGAAISPLAMPCAQILPALLCGCPVVYKPSKLAPATGQVLAEIFEQIELPPGVFNLVQGEADAGLRLAAHPKIQVVLFAGSVAGGRNVLQACAEQPHKKIVIHSGGLNLAAVLKDAELEQAVCECVKGAYLTTGQRYTSTGIVMIEGELFEDFRQAFVGEASRLSIGYAFEEGVFLGPVLSSLARERFLDLQGRIGRAGHKQLLKASALKLRRPGYYVGPAVWEAAESQSAEKLRPEGLSFGPDVVLMKFSGDRQGLELAAENSLPLAAAVFGKDEERLQRWTEMLPYGIVNHNLATTDTSPRLPLQGPLGCGNNHPLGVFSQRNCTRPVAGLRSTAPYDRGRLPPGFPPPPKNPAR